MKLKATLVRLGFDKDSIRCGFQEGDGSFLSVWRKTGVDPDVLDQVVQRYRADNGIHISGREAETRRNPFDPNRGGQGR